MVRGTEMDISITTIITLFSGSAVISAIVAGLISLIGGWRARLFEQREAEKRRAYELKIKIHESALKMALEEWKIHNDIAKEQRIAVVPLDVFVFRYVQILMSMQDGTLDVDTLARIQKQVIEMSHIAHDVIAEHRDTQN